MHPVKGSFAWAMMMADFYCLVTRRCPMPDGSSAWRRVVFQLPTTNGIFERWPSGHYAPYLPCQQDMLATDWEIVE